jgi:hypothetical protein
MVARTLLDFRRELLAEPLTLNDYLARRSRDDESRDPPDRIASPRPEGGKP